MRTESESTLRTDKIATRFELAQAGGTTAGELDVTHHASGEKPILVSITGFSGEVDTTLKNDLYVVGFDFVPADRAQYVITGSNNGNVEGRVTDGGKNSLLSKAYSGGTLRAQTHAFANDIVQAITEKPGIFTGKIAFRCEKGGNSEIYVADFDGHNAVAVTQDHSLVASPDWVPGRRELVYTSYKSGSPAIYLQNLGSGERRAIAKYPGSNLTPAVSPNGHDVAMILSKSGRLDLYVSDINGGNLRQLTKNPDDEASPSWAPRGNKICYSSRYKTRAALYTMNPDGSGVHRLSVGGAINLTEPDWSPDGKNIVFTASMGSFQICTVSAEGGDAKVVTEGEDPCWAPNSRTVIFTRRKGDRRVLSLLDVPTKHVKDIAQISGLGSCSQPSWAQ
jgi:TolB protein